MLVLLAALSAPPATAGDVFASVGEEVTFQLAGTWSRLHPSEDGWWYFMGAGGEYWAETVDPDLGGYDDRARLQLTDDGRLQDTQIERCENGDWLVLGSATIDTYDDSAYAWRWDASFTTVSKVTIEERESSRAHNDMAVVCTDAVAGVAYQNGRGGGLSTFFPIEGTAASGISVGSPVEVEMSAMGGSISVRPSDGRIVVADVAGALSREIRLAVFDADWRLVEEARVPVPEGEGFWPQRLLPFDDGWVLVWLARTDTVGAGNEGEVWVGALDADFRLVDSTRVSPEGVANGRPWVSRREGALAVSYDREVQPRATLVQLQSDAVPEDDGLPDTAAEPDDSAGGGAGSGEGVPPSCGCAASGDGTGAALLGAAALLARRRRRG